VAFPTISALRRQFLCPLREFSLHSAASRAAWARPQKAAALIE
jgi:hypothetical protein